MQREREVNKSTKTHTETREKNMQPSAIKMQNNKQHRKIINFDVKIYPLLNW